ncbi:MAG TPA: aldo/keto reductase [Candidatus Methylomirabilis sp.]|nr:aldo/keto reductase [Candidatus Methylomirabilis sp.]
MITQQSRRELLKAGIALGASVFLPSATALAQATPLIQRKIPSTGESLPIIGIGTARRYEAVRTEAERAPLREVLHRFQQMGGKVIDTAPSYGTAETVVGDLMVDLKIRDSLFIATKLGARGRDAGTLQVEQSFKRLRTPKIDLIAVHNLQDTSTQLHTLRQWKQDGRIRYVGITTSFERQHPEFEQTMKAEALDFIQVDYALDNRKADQRILPLAADRGMGVMINLPFGRGRLFRAVQGRSLPPWAGEFDCASWAQFFLKYIVSHPAVTCALPGTAKGEYLVDNLGAARGRLPDAAMRRRMEGFIDGL